MNIVGIIFPRIAVAHRFLILILMCLSLTGLCQMNVHEKQRLIRPLVARLNENPNDNANCTFSFLTDFGCTDQPQSCKHIYHAGNSS